MPSQIISNNWQRDKEFNNEPSKTRGRNILKSVNYVINIYIYIYILYIYIHIYIIYIYICMYI